MANQNPFDSIIEGKEYDLVVLSAKPKKTKSGHQEVLLWLEILDYDQPELSGQRIWHHMMLVDVNGVYTAQWILNAMQDLGVMTGQTITNLKPKDLAAILPELASTVQTAVIKAEFSKEYGWGIRVVKFRGPAKMDLNEMLGLAEGEDLDFVGGDETVEAGDGLL